MDDQIIFKFIIIVFLLGLSGFFSCSEAAFFSLTQLHLHKMQSGNLPFFSYVRNLLKHPRRFLITIIVGNETVNIAISVLTASLFISFLGTDGQWPAIAATTTMLLIFGEAIPKTFGVTNPMPIASLFAPFLTFFSKIERPIVWTLEKISGLFVHLFPKGGTTVVNAVTEDEFRDLIDTSQKEGGLEESQQNLIHQVFDLSDMLVSEVMIPRVDMFCLPVSLSMEEMEEEIIKARHSRVPIYGTDRDDILGILFTRDLLGAMTEKEKPARIQELMRKPYFVPEERSAGSLLRDFQIKKMQIAIVVDEYGGVSGLITIEDILEKLFEDIYNEYGVRENLWQRIDERTFVASGKMPIDDFGSLLDLSIPGEDFDTLGGFVFHLFGKLPLPGEEVNFGDYLLRVEKMAGARISRVRIERKMGDSDV